MASGDGTLQGSGGGPGQNWNQSREGGFIGPIPPDSQETMDLTQDEGSDQAINGNKTGSSNRSRDRNFDGHHNRDRWNRNRDWDERDRSHGDRYDRGNRNDREREDYRVRSRTTRGRERNSRFNSRDRPLLPGMPGNPGMGGPGVPDNAMMIPGLMQPYGTNILPVQPPLDMQNPNMIPVMNVPPNMMGNMMMPGQMPGQMPVQMQGMMPGQIHGQMPGQIHGQMPGQIHGQMPGQIHGQMHGQIHGQMHEQMHGQMHGQMPGQIPGLMDQNMMVAHQMQMLASAQPIYIQAGVLLTPIPGMALPPRRERPLGCRTIFLGGLPPGIGMDTIKEIFQRFGDIDDVKLHKQGVCHIRFAKQEMVEMSFFLTGYRFKSHDQSENEATTLFIDYALNRDDQSEGERQKRDPTPPRIEPFTPAALNALIEKIKSDTDFAESAPTLAGWLEKGECHKKNANTFYSLIQATNNQVRRLYTDKMSLDEEYQTFKTTMKEKYAHIVFQFEQVAKILSAAKHKKASDHFTKQQRRNVEMWLKMTEDLVNLKEEFNMLFDDEEHEKIGQKTVSADKYEQLKTENDTLISELEGYKNEAHMAKDEAERKFEKFKAQYIAQQALQGGRMHQQTDNDTLTAALERYKNEAQRYKNEAHLAKDEAERKFENFKAQYIAQQASNGGRMHQHQGIMPPLPPPPQMPSMEPHSPFKPPPTPSYPPALLPTPDDMNQRQIGSPNDAKLVATLTAFLLAHPLGATIDYLTSYIRSMFPSVTHHSVNSVLQKNGDVFARQGADRWTFVLFDIVKKEH